MSQLYRINTQLQVGTHHAWYIALAFKDLSTTTLNTTNIFQALLFHGGFISLSSGLQLDLFLHV